MWLPAVGAVLFLTAGLIWGLYPSKDESAPEATPAASATASASAGKPAAPRQ